MAGLKLIQAFHIEMFSLFPWDKRFVLPDYYHSIGFTSPSLSSAVFFIQVSSFLLFTAELCFEKVLNPLHHTHFGIWNWKLVWIQVLREFLLV